MARTNLTFWEAFALGVAARLVFDDSLLPIPVGQHSDRPAS